MMHGELFMLTSEGQELQVCENLGCLHTWEEDCTPRCETEDYILKQLKWIGKPYGARYDPGY